MAKTASEIRHRVGEDLSIIAIGATLNAEDDARIEAAYNECYDRLKELGLAIWALSGSVPDALVPAFSSMIEATLLVSYSVPTDRYNRIILMAGQNGEFSVNRIAALVAQGETSTDGPEDF